MEERVKMEEKVEMEKLFKEKEIEIYLHPEDQ